MCIKMPNFVTIGQTVAEIRPFFNLSKMVAICHLGFMMRVFGSPMNDIWRPLSLCKISLQLMQYSFNIVQVLIFCELGLKTPIHAPKIGVSI